MQRCKARDFYELPSSRETTPQGFLRAPAKIARTGVQPYSSRELGLDGGDKILKLFRPPEEVAKSARSFESVPMADEHPPGDITADNWKLLAVGDVRDVSMDGDFLAACVIVRDADAISIVRDGKAELSCGYSFNLDMTPGVTPAGEPYDAIQRDIEGNHVAIVDRGRAGSRVRIADRNRGDQDMPKTHRIAVADHKVTDKLTIPGLSFDVELEDAAAKSVQDKFDLHAHGIGAAKDAYDNLMTAHKALQGHAEAMQDRMDEMGAAAEPDGDESDVIEEDDAAFAGAETPEEEAAEKTKTGDRRVGYSKDGRPGFKVRLKRALDEIKRLRATTAQDAIEKAAEERAKVLDAAKVFLAEEFDGKGKSVHEIRLAAIDAAGKDEALAPVVKAQLGSKKLEKLTSADAARAFDTIVAVGGKKTVEDDGGDPDLSRALAGGDDTGGAPAQAYGRDAWLHRSASDSRKKTSGDESRAAK